MAKGQRFSAEWFTFNDRETGIAIQQLTNYKGHSYHLYFTNSGWYTDSGGDKLIFGSDRCNKTNLFSLDLQSGEIIQLTEFDSVRNSEFLFSSLNPCYAEIYFWHDRVLFALDLLTLDQRRLWSVPDGYAINMTSVTADGKFVCTAIYEDLSKRFPVDLLHGYIGFAEYWQAMPHSKILRIATENGNCQTVFEEDYWIGHVNASPTRANLATFCHEGPWDKVDQRIWGLNLESGQVWKIRPTDSSDQVGHEYWLADGEYIGYHGKRVDGNSFYGSIRYDNTIHTETAFKGESMHFHSNNDRLIVGDSNRDNPRLLLWKKTADRYEGPRTILLHRGTFQTQQLHVHPRFSPDGSHILFTSDLTGYGNLYSVKVPDFDRLQNLI
jgi:oligogalacturonide lyase